MQQEKDGLKRINTEQLKLGSLQQEQETNKETVRQRLQALLTVAKDLDVPGEHCLKIIIKAF